MLRSLVAHSTEKRKRSNRKEIDQQPHDVDCRCWVRKAEIMFLIKSGLMKTK
ncbi:hypothetical protein ISN45_At01g001520 [Arabidopsis thaliana x Arabidopsis arenosa]|uniref:Uncharacterized protein n=2 Tax=Arabidopsis TaxID=3701 RepID=A0A8T2GZP6_ARASU|nr:hypothetical protein ISN45_At01g001520 [Arabidopsis thaliana x Arabidopsis arenosa]KAG7652806.1 hypothetical protein ISN44_As01g001410 [Arabidopsis suecica]